MPKVHCDTWVAAEFSATPIEVADRAAWDAMLASVSPAADLFTDAHYVALDDNDRTGDKP